MKNIVLIGMMGCGKTTVAQLLAQRLNRPLVDIDEYIVEKYQMSIPSMFDISEAYFRERESLCCREVSQLEGYIISTGGGIVKDKMNCDVLKENAIIIYLDRPVEMILTDVDTTSRPLLKDGADKLYELYHQRHKLYLDNCDYHIYNDCSLEELLVRIEEVIK